MIHKGVDYITKSYQPEMFDDLKEMLELFVEETFDEESRSDSVDTQYFLDCHQIVYLVYADGKPIAFTSFCYNDYYGLRKPTIGNSYLYVKQGYRKSIAFHLLVIQTGLMVEENEFNLEHYYAAGSPTNACIGKMKGKLLYQTYEYDRQVVIDQSYKLQGIFK